MNEIRISAPHYESLVTHLFRVDHDEHAAALLAGVRHTSEGLRLLIKEVLPVADPDFPPGEYGYRMISPRFVMQAGRRAADEQLALILAHSHPAADTTVALSSDDLAGHRRGFPHLLDITAGTPVAGVVLGQRSAAGEIWTGKNSHGLDRMTVLGEQWQRLTPSSRSSRLVPHRFDRQVRMFGADGQTRLRELHVGVVGAGGGGSLLTQSLAHLGVGHLTIVDFDRVSEHNLSRIVGSEPKDARAAAKKVDVARRLVGRIDPSIRVVAIDGDISDPGVATALLDCDVLLVATDTHTSRLVANAIACAHLIPTIQIGAKVDSDDRGEISAIYSVTRPVLPSHACLYCQRAIDPLLLQRESASDEELAAQNYINAAPIIDPSVISLNAAGAAAAVNALLFAAVGLGKAGLWQSRLADAQTGDWLPLRAHRDPNCPWCGSSPSSQYARGDAAFVPTQMRSQQSAHRRRHMGWRNKGRPAREKLASIAARFR